MERFFQLSSPISLQTTLEALRVRLISMEEYFEDLRSPWFLRTGWRASMSPLQRRLLFSTVRFLRKSFLIELSILLFLLRQRRRCSG